MSDTFDRMRREIEEEEQERLRREHERDAAEGAAAVAAALSAGSATFGGRRRRKARAKPVADDGPGQLTLELDRPEPPPRTVIDGSQGWLAAPCFYVSVIDGSNSSIDSIEARARRKFGLLLGPFPTHRHALDRLDLARTLAERCDSRAVFYGYGTVKYADGSRDGRLNDLAGIVIRRDGTELMRRRG